VPLDTKIQQSSRNTAAKKLRQILNTNHDNTTHERQLHVLKQIKLEITEGNAGNYRQWNAVRSPDDGHKDVRDMLRYY